MSALIDAILKKVRDPEFTEYVADLLIEICRVDTTPYADIDRMRRAENDVFTILERELASIDFPAARCERRPINPAISEHPAFSLLHFTKTDENPDGLTPEETYAERCNLLYSVPGQNGYEGPDGVAVNAHIDVVKPFIPPTLENGVIRGRGACDDKGAIVAMIAAMRVLAEVLRETGQGLRKNLLGMFVIEEETGGNGSLSLAVDRELKQLYSSMLVLECASNGVFPANRGAIWYRADLVGEGINLFELFAFVIEQLEQEGRSIKAESRHNLFPQRPVQTCHGIIGNYGEHPSRICGEVSFCIDTSGDVSEGFQLLVGDAIEAALAEYTAVYGDKTKLISEETGIPKVDHHYDLERGDHGLVCHVHGSTGHMGAILENDGAITKMACFVRALFRSKGKLAEIAGADVNLRLAGDEDAVLLTLEGGQGFVPTHDINEIMARVKIAAENGAATYLRLVGNKATAENVVRVTFDKLHNAAFDGDPNSPTMQNAIKAAASAGTRDENQEVMGWTVSCDSRLFATEYSGMPVLTSGAGHLTHAHSDEEHIRLDELSDSIAFIAAFLLLEAM